jgi:CRP/FNR family transcriptional regulator, cyclic AMP receptor protein
MKSDILGLLQGVDLFSSLSNEQLQIICDVVQPKTYQKDEIIIHEDESSFHAFFLIASGDVKVFLTGGEGKETILALLTKGDFFGEMSLIDGEPRSASVKAFTKADLLVIHREDFLQQLQKFPDLSTALLLEMSRRLRKANRQIGSLALLSVFGRVAGTLLNLIEEKGIRTHTESGRMVTIIKNKPTQQQLADMSGTTRETVSRVLSGLQKSGCISLTGKDMIIYEVDELKTRTE